MANEDFIIKGGVDFSDIYKGFEIAEKEVTDRVAKIREVNNSMRGSFDDSAKAAGRARDALGKFIPQESTDNAAKLNQAVNTVTGSIGGSGGMISVVSKLGGVLASVFAVKGLLDYLDGIVKTRAEFQKFQAVLTNTLGSSGQAQKALQMLSDFAARTPFQINELTESYVKLVNRGFIPTENQLTKLGDLAASQGKSFDQLTEAILDAQTGEFERLKEFGIRASSAGNSVTLSFGGVSKTVNKTEKDIRNAILAFGDLPQVAGGMEAISKTIGGQISNISDNFTRLSNLVGEKLEPVINEGLSLVSSLLASVYNFVQSNGIEDFLDPAIEGLGKFMKTIRDVVNAVYDFAKQSGILKDIGQIIGGLVRVVGNLYSFFAATVDKFAELYDSSTIFRSFVDNVKRGFVEVFDAIRDVVTIIGDLPTAFAALKAYTDVVNANIANRFNSLVDTVKVVGLEIRKAFTFNDSDTAALQNRIDTLKAEAIKLDNLSKADPNKAAADAFKQTIAEEEGRARARKEIRQREKQYDNEDVTDVTGRPGATTPTTPGLTAGQQSKLEAQQKKFNDLIAKFQDQRRELEAKAIQDNLDSELAASHAKQDNLIAETTKELNEAKTTGKQKAEAEAEAQKLISAAQQAGLQERADIRAKYAAIDQKAEDEAQKVLETLIADSTEKQVAKIEQKYGELYDVLEKGGKATDENVAKLIAAKNAEIAGVNITTGQKIIDDQEKNALATIDLETKYAGKSVAIARKKEADKLDVQLKAAQGRLQLLLNNGKSENDLEVKQARKTVQDLKNAITNQGEQAKDDGPNIFDYFGLNEKKILKYANRASEAGRVASQFLGMVADSFQQAIDAQKQVVEEDDKRIDALQSNLDKEKELLDQGRANNYDTLQQKLKDAKAQRAADLKNLEEAQKKQDAVRKAQIIADGLSQVSNLVTASSEIFRVLGKLGPIGVALAVVTIGAMLGSFAIAKANAVKAVGAKQTFGGGGEVDGPSHRQGGKKYRAIDGSGDVVELEGGEYVTNKKSTAKARPLLEAINEGSLFEMSDAALGRMLDQMGVSSSIGKAKDVVRTIHIRDRYQHQATLREAKRPDYSQDIAELKEDLKYLAKREKAKPIATEDAKHYSFQYDGGLTKREPKARIVRKLDDGYKEGITKKL